jgi:hypothetical protein
MWCDAINVLNYSLGNMRVKKSPDEMRYKELLELRDNLNKMGDGNFLVKVVEDRIKKYVVGKKFRCIVGCYGKEVVPSGTIALMMHIKSDEVCSINMVDDDLIILDDAICGLMSQCVLPLEQFNVCFEEVIGDND